MDDGRLIHSHGYPLTCRVVEAAARQHRAGKALHFDARRAPYCS